MYTEEAVFRSLHRADILKLSAEQATTYLSILYSVEHRHI